MLEFDEASMVVEMEVIEAKDEAVKFALGLLTGDYLSVFLDGLRQQVDQGDMSEAQAHEDMEKMINGIHVLCDAFQIDHKELDVDRLMTDKYGERCYYI